MIGIFDSGIGGLNALYEIRKLKPGADICFYADRKNAPYGTKTEGELIKLVKKDISRLTQAGAEAVLIACCTASTVYGSLPDRMREIALPIIDPTVKEVLRVTRSGKIGVIATEATVRSGAFTESLENHGLEAAAVTAAQNLVNITEAIASGEKITNKRMCEISGIIKPFKEKNIDTLILGCTHFQRIEREIAGMLPGVRLVSSAREGAREMAKRTGIFGRGRTFYL